MLEWIVIYIDGEDHEAGWLGVDPGWYCIEAEEGEDDEMSYGDSTGPYDTEADAIAHLP